MRAASWALICLTERQARSQVTVAVMSGLVLQVRNLAIDVAARRMLSDASFTVAAGDKVGLVGRNGAGKTSLLKVLAGDDDAAAGVVLRRGTLGYVPQNPRPRAEAAPTALTHILSGRGLDRAAARLAELHTRLEHDHSLASIERYSAAEESYRLDGGYSSESDARRIAGGLGLRLDRSRLCVPRALDTQHTAGKFHGRPT